MFKFNGCLCFDIPFQVDKGNLLYKEYYQKIDSDKHPKGPNEKKGSYDIKKAFVEKFRASFANCSPVLPCDNNGTILNNYESRFLCHCVSVSKKFLDDENHGNLALQFSLGRYPITYSYKQGKTTRQVSFDIFLTIHSRAVHQGSEDIQTHLLLHIPFKNQSTDDIIFLKHLFYKKKLQCAIAGEEEKKDLKGWASERLKQVDKIINRKKTSGLVFQSDNSLLEVSPVGIDPKKCGCKDVKSFGEEHAGLIYGLLTSDEGWGFIDEQEAKNRTNIKWSLRPFECYFFIYSNCLILNFDPEHKSESYKKSEIDLFKKYQYTNSENQESQKYTEYCRIAPCIAGVKSMLLFTFQELAYKKMKIISAINRSDDLLNKAGSQNSPKLVKELRTHQYYLFKEIDQNVFGAPEMLNVQSILANGFGIPGLVEQLKEKYNRTVVVLENEHETKNNNIIRWLTIATICIGVSQIVMMFYNKYYINIISLYEEININNPLISFVWYAISIVLPLVTLFLGFVIMVIYLLKIPIAFLKSVSSMMKNGLISTMKYLNRKINKWRNER